MITGICCTIKQNIKISVLLTFVVVLLSRECPLMLCAERGYFELISLLLERYCLSVWQFAPVLCAQ